MTKIKKIKDKHKMSENCGYYKCDRCYNYGYGYRRNHNPYGYGLGYTGGYGGAEWLYIAQLFYNTRDRRPVRRMKNKKRN